MKRLIQIGLILISLIFLLAGDSSLASGRSEHKKNPRVKPYAFDDTLANRRYNLDSLKKIIGENKGLPPGFETAAAIAYSAFPQLKDVNIDMILTEEGAPMESTVEIGSLFGGRKNRRYHILLNDARNSFFDPISTSFPSF